MLSRKKYTLAPLAPFLSFFLGYTVIHLNEKMCPFAGLSIRCPFRGRKNELALQAGWQLAARIDHDLIDCVVVYRFYGIGLIILQRVALIARSGFEEQSQGYLPLPFPFPWSLPPGPCPWPEWPWVFWDNTKKRSLLGLFRTSSESKSSRKSCNQSGDSETVL